MALKDERYDFDVMLMDTLVAEARIINSHYQITTNPDIFKSLQVFAMPNPNDYHVYEFLKSRCYDDGRPDLPEILAEANMTSNNPFQWCKLTHGYVWGDYYWIRFKDETLTWKDVCRYERV